MAEGNETVDTTDGAGDQSRKIARRKNYIPYVTVYKSQDEVRRQGYWIPGVPVHARIIHVEKDETSNFHRLNPFIYTIELTHGKFCWTVKRRYKDFSYLSNRLITHRAMERLKAPVRRARSKIEDALDDEDEAAGGDPNKAYELQILSKVKEMSDFGLQNVETVLENGKGSPDEKEDTPDIPENATLPNFPLVPDAMLSDAHMQERRARLEKWLQCVLSIPINRDYHETAEFLEVSRYSFINELGGKYREGEIKKRPGGSKVYIGLKNFCVKFVLPWGHRWLIVKDSYCCYVNPHTETVRLVLLFDEQFEIDAMDLGVTIKPRTMVLSNLAHVLATKCYSEEDAKLWKQTIRGVLDTTGQPWLHKKRFGSSFPVRNDSHVQWFVDAKDYWEKAAAMLEIAREEIFIADWWLCPEIYMKRPMAEGNYWRLGDILKRQAQRGVRIFILLYKEMEMALTLNSAYSKKYLQDLHPNIRVMRHPDHYFGTGTFFWAHHEKLIIIDQLIAFVGGLDLCYGRWDNSSHVLTDLGSVKFATKSEGVTMRETLADAVQEATAVTHQPAKNLDEEISDTDKPAEIHMLTEDIIDEKTGKKIGVRTTRTVKSADHDLGQTTPRRRPRIAKSADQEPTETPQRGRLRNIAARALHLNRAQRTPGTPPATRRPAARNQSSSRSRSPTPFDNMDQRTPLQRRPDLIFDPHHRQRALVHQTFPFGTRAIRFRNFQAGREPSVTPVDTPDGDTRIENSLEVAKNANFSTPTLAPGDQKTRKIAMEPHSRTLMRRVVSNLKTNRSRKRWQMILEKQDDAAEEYVINYCKVQETEVDVSNLAGAGKLWPGKDYVNYMVKDFVDVQDAYSDFINRYEIPRTPWHDIHALVYGDAARDVARHFIQRWNATKTEKLKNDSNYPYLLPKSYDSVRVPRVFINQNTHKASVQVIRSVSHWSILIDKTEDSIQQAYLSLIANAKHYVYIENQFFVSMINSSEVVNEVCRVLFDRIVTAHRNNEVFRVFILLPLLPGFEGKISAADYSALLAVLHWTLRSIGQGPHSLLENLRNAGIEDPSQYVVFCSLRQYDVLKDQLVTEQIYIHSKLLIIDDKYTIIGSANINDRSQCGNRDSEVCLLIEDQEFVPSTMNGQPYQAGKFASSLRKQLMSEHLGLHDDALHKTELESPPSLDDPIADSFYLDVWLKAANENTQIFEEVFRCYPTNYVNTYEELQAWQVEVPMAQYDEELARKTLKRLMGTLVRFPEEFLKSENLSPTITSKEGLVPAAVFT